MAYLYIVLYITGFGAVGIRHCVSLFGADHFDERSRDYKVHLDRFFNFFYLSVTIRAIITFTIVVYLQMKYGWGSSFGALAIAMGMSNFVFFISTPMYRQRFPGGSPSQELLKFWLLPFRREIFLSLVVIPPIGQQCKTLNQLGL